MAKVKSFLSAEAGEPIQFTYSGAAGPDRWGSLNPKFLLCKNGKLRSPINILKGNKRLKPLIRYAAELHQVHIADDGNVSVVAVIFKYGKPNPVVAKIQNKLNELAHKAKRHEEAPITLRHFHSTELRKRFHKYYKYVGSLTNPPCTENVIWHVLGKVKSISREQVKALKAPLYQRSKNTARPFQPKNGRHVELYEDKPFAQGNQYPKNKCKQW
ncbi:hypothetical protein Pfo_031672 [Paulownia fortunei]|nr:hypothetical protein Pfo_028618 [Paulownia fortunei]KAI3473353.1 hypothetical protein Pfo_031672 [Paulownia fortunei]